MTDSGSPGFQEERVTAEGLRGSQLGLPNRGLCLSQLQSQAERLC